jgi:polyisoprenoid-binding protein YceI
MADSAPNAPAAAQLLSSGRVVGPWVLDPDQSSVTFAVKHFWGLITVRGRFHGVSGHGDVSQSGAVNASIRIDAASLDTGNRRRDDHLRSADFFDTDTHPSVEITTTRVEPPTSSESWSVAADLTAAGHTEPVELDLALEDANEQSVRVRGKLVTDRTRFSMTWSPLRMASSIAELDVDLRFVRNAGD